MLYNVIIFIIYSSLYKVKSVAKRKLEMVKKSILVCQRSYLVLFLIIRKRRDMKKGLELPPSSTEQDDPSILAGSMTIFWTHSLYFMGQ